MAFGITAVAQSVKHTLHDSDRHFMNTQVMDTRYHRSKSNEQVDCTREKFTIHWQPRKDNTQVATIALYTLRHSTKYHRPASQLHTLDHRTLH